MGARQPDAVTQAGHRGVGRLGRAVFGGLAQHAAAQDHHRLHARALGEPLERARHEPAVEVKGATYTALRVAPADGGWVAQAVVDV